MTNPTTRQNQNRPKLAPPQKNETGPTVKTFERAVQIRGYIFRSKFAKLSGSSQKCHFFGYYLFYVLNRVSAMSIGGWRSGERN